MTLPTPTRTAALAWLVVLAVAAAALISAASRARAAHEQADRAESSLHHAHALASEIAALRAKAPTWMSARREETGLSPRLTAVITSAGLPASALASFNVSRESNLGGKELGAARQRASCVLTNLTLPQLGQVLTAWHEREPQWAVASIDLDPIESQSPPAGGDIPLKANIILESVYVEDRSASSPKN